MTRGKGEALRLKRDWWILLILLFATVHCAQSIFYDNWSFLDLEKYANGQEKMPFQGRVAMMPLLRWAHTSPALTRYAKAIEEQPGDRQLIVESYTPEKLVSFWAAIASLLALVAMCSWYGFAGGRTCGGSALRW